MLYLKYFLMNFNDNNYINNILFLLYQKSLVFCIKKGFYIVNNLNILFQCF